MRGAESVGKNHIVIMSVIAARGVPGRVLVVVGEGVRCCHGCWGDDASCPATERLEKVRATGGKEESVGGGDAVPRQCSLSPPPFSLPLHPSQEKNPHPSLLSCSLPPHCPPPFGRISRVSLEGGKCNNATTRWNRAPAPIIRREMDGPCRAGGGHGRTQFRFNKLAKQDNHPSPPPTLTPTPPQSDLSLTGRRR